MKHIYLSAIMPLMFCMPAISQNINQNVNQNINNNSNTVVIQNQPVIEKKVYIERYRPVYIERPQPKRVARRLPAPICLQGFLWVYPEDLGTYVTGPDGIISQINSQGRYGRNNWRVPYPEELRLMENYADECGLGDDIYLATDHRNGVLRLVSTGMSVVEQRNASAEAERQRRLEEKKQREQREREERQMAEARASARQAQISGQSRMLSSGTAILVDGILWNSMNKGAKSPLDKGVVYNNSSRPDSGWRLPTENEFYNILRKAGNDGTNLRFNGLVIPIASYAITMNDGSYGYINLQSGFVTKGSGYNVLIRYVQDRVY